MDRALAWRRLRQSVLAHPFLSQLLVLAALDVAIHWTLLTQFTGYIAWVNFDTPYTPSQAPTSPDLFWSPFQYNGIPVNLPFYALSTYVEGLAPLAILSSWVGVTDGAKLYILLTTLFVGASALLLSRTLIRRPLGQLAAGVFVLAGPSQFVLYGQGDYQAFVAEGLVFLTLYAIWRAVHHPTQRWLWLPAAAWMLVFTFQVLQAFLLGLLLVAILLPVYVWDWRRSTGPGGVHFPPVEPGEEGIRSALARVGQWIAAQVRASVKPHGILRDLGAYFARLPGLIAVAAVIIVPAYVTFYILGRGATGASSTLAVPLPVFASYARSPFAVLTLNGYFNFGPTMVRAGAGGEAALALWTVVALSLLALLWVAYFFVRDARLLYLLVVTVLAAVIGAGPSGTLSAVSVFLYLHFPGYAAINTSYYWDWFILGPLDALMLGILLEGLSRPHLAPTASAPSGPGISSSRLVPRVARFLRDAPQHRRWTLVRTTLSLGVCLLLVGTVLVPVANGAYYTRPDGIYEATYPTSYGQVPGLLNQLIGSSYAGVALFNPDVNWLMSNSTRSVPNAFFLFPTVRTAGLPYYLAPPSQSNAYFYWLYGQFYSNSTRYAGQLFALAGVEYFVVFYGTQSASFYPNFLPASEGKNASVLLRYQPDVVPVVQAKNFAIYRDLAFNGVALADSTLSLVAGPGYDELNALAYAGVSLANQSWLFPSDLLSNGCSAELGRTDRVYTSSLNALIGVALACDHVSVTDPLAETLPTGDPTQVWVPSTNDPGVPIFESWPTTLAATDSRSSTIDVPIAAGNCSGDCRIWLPVRSYGDAGSLTFGWDGASWAIPTNLGISGANNTMVWISLPFHVSSSGSLSIRARGGWNAVGSVYVFAGGPEAPFLSPVDWLNRTFAGVPVIQVTPASAFNLTPSNGRQGLLGYFSLAATQVVNSLPGNQGIVMIDANSAEKFVHLPIVKPSGPGSVALLIQAANTGYVNVTLGDGGPTQLVGFSAVKPSPGGPSPAWQPVLIPWNTSAPDLGSGLTLTLLSGSLWLGAVWFVPDSIAGTFSTHPVARPTLGTPTLAPSPGTVVSRLTSGVNASGFGSVALAGTFGPAATFGASLLNLSVPVSVPPGYALALSVNATPGVWISVNGVAVGGTPAGGSLSFGALLQQPGYLRSSSLMFGLATYWPFPDSETAFSVTARFAYVVLPLAWNVTDFPPAASIAVTGDTSGYQVQAGGTPLVLVRVGDYSGMVTSGGAVLGSSLGTVDTLLWNPANASAVSVSPGSITTFDLAAGLSLLATAVWVAAELWVRQRRARRSGSAGDRSPPADAVAEGVTPAAR